MLQLFVGVDVCCYAATCVLWVFTEDEDIFPFEEQTWCLCSVSALGDCPSNFR